MKPRTFWPGFRWRILAHERTKATGRGGSTGEMYDRRSGSGPIAPTDGPTPIKYLDGIWELDELVIDHWFHIEQMSARHWWIGLGSYDEGSDYWHINVSIDGQRRVTVLMEQENSA